MSVLIMAEVGRSMLTWAWPASLDWGGDAHRLQP